MSGFTKAIENTTMSEFNGEEEKEEKDRERVMESVCGSHRKYYNG